MNATMFVEGLKGCAPSAKEIELQGLSPDEAEQLRACYVVSKTTAVDEQALDDPVLFLVDNYDVSQLEVGLITFCRRAGEPQSKRIGYVEVDYLIIDRPSGEVQVEDYGSEGFILWRCALNSSALLDALLHLACFYSKSMVDESLYSNHERREECASHCALLAGDVGFLPFYAMLLS